MQPFSATNGSALATVEPVRNGTALLDEARSFADRVAAEPPEGAPLAELAQMHELGLLAASLPSGEGGLGLGTEPGMHGHLLELLAIVGGANLPLGRLFEGHVNALILIWAYGTAGQQARAARDARAGLLFGVWNTGPSEALRLEAGHGGWTYAGGKTFASGAGFVERPLITAELPGAGWQMTLPRMDTPEVAEAVRIDRSSWNPLGMEASNSFHIDFTGARIDADDLIGKPGEFYRDPLFRGGAIRFAAVQAGAVERLHRRFVAWLTEHGRADDPYQLARVGENAIGARECALWLGAGAAAAEQALAPEPDAGAGEQMVACANMMRAAVERIASAMVERVIRGVGARGLLHAAGFEQPIRDLLMYLRQPAPDAALADVGRFALHEHGKH